MTPQFFGKTIFVLFWLVAIQANAQRNSVAKTPEQGPATPLAKDQLKAPSQQGISVYSARLTAVGEIPLRNTAYGENVSLPVSWNDIEEAKSYAIIIEDPDAKPKTVVHWIIWNIPAGTTTLPEGMKKPGAPASVVQGASTKGPVGYAGPHPPIGDPVHHYHIQVFALDTLLTTKSGSTRDQLVAAMTGHVIARGEVVGIYAQTAAPGR